MQAWAPSESEWQLAVRCIYDGFGTTTEPDADALRDGLRAVDRRVAVGDEQGVIGGCFAYDFTLSLPGGTRCQVGGLAGVGISPTAQGRGGLQAMMLEHLRQSKALGDAASVLMASESGLYDRYGYGVATEMAQWHLHTREFSVIEAINSSSSQVDIRLIHDRSEAIRLLAPIHATYCASRAMEIIRDECWWRYMLDRSEAGWTSVGKDKFIAVSYNSSGVADGYVIYSIDEGADTGFSHGRPDSTVTLTEICAHSPEAEAGLFSYLVKLPWCRKLVWELGPVDPQVRHFMRDPRQLWQQSRLDMMWLRPINVEQLLSARTYAREGRVELDYTDPLFPELSGRWQLTVSEKGVRLDPSRSNTSMPSVVLGPSALGAVYAGTTRVTELAAVGKVTGDPEQIALFDQMLLGARAPFNSTRF